MTTFAEAFQGNVGVGTNDPGSYRLLISGGTSKFSAIEASSLTVNGITNSFIPAGIIAVWSGTGASIPSGWALCDGQNGTPDLRDRFVVGAGNAYAVDGTGGSHNKTLVTGNLPSHTHSGAVDNSGTHLHNSTSTSQGAHTHGANTSDTGSHTHGIQTTATGDHAHGGQVAANGWHAHGTYRESWGNGQWGNLGGGWRNAFTGVNGHKQSWGPGYGMNWAGWHGHNYNLGQGGGHTHGIQVQNGGAHTHNMAHSQVADHTHTTTTIGQSSQHTHNFTSQATGQGQSFSIIPPYYALAYIMKL